MKLRVAGDAILDSDTWMPQIAVGILHKDLDAGGLAPTLRALIDDFVDRLTADPRIGSFFGNSNLPRLKAQLAAQLCAVSGGPCRYAGADMRSAHATMGVEKRHFNALVEVLQQSMDAKGVPFHVQNRMLAQLAPMHREIITR